MVHDRQRQVEPLVGEEGEVVDVGAPLLGAVEDRRQVRGIVEEPAHAREAVLLVLLVGVEDQLRLGPGVEVAARGQGEGAPVGTAPLGGGDEQAARGVVGEVGLVEAGHDGALEVAPVDAVGGDGGLQGAGVVAHALEPPLGVRVGGVVDRPLEHAVGRGQDVVGGAQGRPAQSRPPYSNSPRSGFSQLTPSSEKAQQAKLSPPGGAQGERGSGESTSGASAAAR